ERSGRDYPPGCWRAAEVSRPRVATMERGGSTRGDEMPAGASGGCGRILVCDDTEQIRQLIRVNLELEGYEVVEAVDGQEALEILLDTSQPLPHVVSMRTPVPWCEGWCTVSVIRTDPSLERIPI